MSDETTAPDLYAVMGNPIGHSKSPDIHTRFAAQTGQNLEYQAILVGMDGFRDAVIDFANKGGKGLNVTVPFKQKAFDLATTLSERAELAGAVNTLIFRDDGALEGENTDGVGMIRDITVNNGIALKGKRILVLGAGGAVRGVLSPLIDEAPALIHIANRTALTAQELAAQFSEIADGRVDSVTGGGFERIAEPEFDFIINGTAASLSGEVPPIRDDILAEGGSCYDMMYSNEPTAFCRWAEDQNAVRALDGLGMLVEQAAESFNLWRGIRPDTAPVIDALREH